MRPSLALLALACTPTAATSRPPAPDQIAACTSTLELLGSADSHSVRQLAEGCGYDCRGLYAYAFAAPGARTRALLVGCDVACNERALEAAANADPAYKWPLLAETCGASHYGLPADQTALMSPQWFVVHRIGAWIHRTGDSALVRAATDVLFQLPLPTAVRDDFRLPDSMAVAPIGGATTYVVVDSATVRAAALPMARITPGGAALAEVPGGTFPGAEVALPALEERVRALQAEVAARDPRRGRVNVWIEDDEVPAAPFLTSLSDEHRATFGAAPLLLADRGLPAARLVEVLRALPTNGARLAVARGILGQHRLWLGVVAGFRPDEGYPTLVLRGGEIALVAPGTTDAPAPLNDVLLERLGEDLAPIPRNHPGLTAVFITLDDPAVTVQDLTILLDAAGAAGFDLALIVDPAAPHHLTLPPWGPSLPPPPAPETKLVVRVGPMTGTAGLDPNIVRRYVRQKLPDLHACVAGTSLTGTITVSFTIRPEGRVSDADARGLGDAAVERCVRDVVAAIHFPKPDGGARQKISFDLVIARE